MSMRTHLFCDVFQMSDYKVVALWVVERGKAPRVLEGYEVGLLRVVVEVYGPEAPNLLSGHL